ncbi:hypothetical protein D1AOALGA4SA_1093 [Olavius algarvensis Delta 1 endosymbiont]|nr:hypothetical protein D1AOALGA4SA_1093 [Olavius algarvensis Delta 1 endosymbiont]
MGKSRKIVQLTAKYDLKLIFVFCIQNSVQSQQGLVKDFF